jgi:hypothetical protein
VGILFKGGKMNFIVLVLISCIISVNAQSKSYDDQMVQKSIDSALIGKKLLPAIYMGSNTPSSSSRESLPVSFSRQNISGSIRGETFPCNTGNVSFPLTGCFIMAGGIIAGIITICDATGEETFEYNGNKITVKKEWNRGSSLCISLSISAIITGIHIMAEKK